MNELFGMSGKRLLVLGGGFGMGEATALLLASLGAHIAVADREGERAQDVVDKIVAAGGTAIPLCVDVLDDEALIAAIVRADRDFGPIDGMVSVIGMAAWSSLLDMDLDTWDEDHNRNLRYFFVAACEVARSLIARGAPGSIVGVGSIDGERCAPYHGSYGVAKAGLSNLVKTMANEWAPHNIRTNVISPGAIVTPRIPHLAEDEGQIADHIPMRRRGTVNDIAKAITFMISDLASYVTGQTLLVDGGMLAKYPLDLPDPATKGA